MFNIIHKKEERDEKGLPHFSAPKGCVTPLYVCSNAFGRFLVYGCHYPLTSTTCCFDKLTPSVKKPLRPCPNPDGYTDIPGRCPHNVLENVKFTGGPLAWNYVPRPTSAV